MPPADDASTAERLRQALGGRYTMHEPVGRGGMAIVFRATRDADGAAVAIKVLLPHLADAVTGSRFVREVELASRLDHPGVVGVLDSGEADGLPFYVMPFITGETLRDRLDRERPLPVDEALRITRQVGEALAAAHACGIVHRDIKPENVLLTGDRAVVADFGVARGLAEAGGEKLTRTGMIVGTPSYLSPEQTGSTGGITEATDQYALACVTYEMLAGEAPFRGATPIAIMAKHAMEPPPGLRVVRPEVPGHVEGAIRRALAKQGSDRFPSVAAYLDALEGRAPVEAPPSAPAATAASAPAGGPRVKAGCGASVALVVAGVASLVGWLV